MNYFTIDFEDWFNVVGSRFNDDIKRWSAAELRIEIGLGKILSLLSDKNIKCHFFIVGWFAEVRPDLIRRIVQHGHIIGSHSYSHRSIEQLTREEFREDLLRSKRAIYAACGKEVDSFRAPSFSVTETNYKWFFEELALQGFKHDFSVFPMSRENGGLARFKCEVPFSIQTFYGSIREYPITSRSFLGKKMVVSGGGYFRLAPFWLIKRIFLKSHFNMLYFHPREFDENAPVLQELGLAKRLKYHVGIKGLIQKLNRILDYPEINAQFVTFKDLDRFFVNEDSIQIRL